MADPVIRRGGWLAGAEYSESMEHRYTLWRRAYGPTQGQPRLNPPEGFSWRSASPGVTEPAVCWLMLNPSTATETVLDPTLRRCADFTMRWGYRGFVVCNLFALRSTDPAGLRSHPAPIGPMNDDAILNVVNRCALTIVGWGKHGSFLDRAAHVQALLAERPVYSLRVNKSDGSPGHPLYLPKRSEPALFSGVEDRQPDGKRAWEEWQGRGHEPDCDLDDDCGCSA